MLKRVTPTENNIPAGNPPKAQRGSRLAFLLREILPHAHWSSARRDSFSYYEGKGLSIQSSTGGDMRLISYFSLQVDSAH